MSSEDLDAGTAGFGSDVIKLLALLHLNSAAAAAAVISTTRTPFSSAARSKKRRSYSSSPYFRRSLSKRANLHSSAAKNLLLSLTPPSPPPLQDPSVTETTQVSDSSKAQFLKSPSPQTSKNDDISLPTPLPPLPRPLRHSLSGPISPETRQNTAAQAVPPPPLRRSTSDPVTPERYQEVVATDTPPAARTLSRSPSSDQDSKDEAVWIEQTGGGGGLIIHFKCPCGGAYAILLSGNTCYYKLM